LLGTTSERLSGEPPSRAKAWPITIGLAVALVAPVANTVALLVEAPWPLYLAGVVALLLLVSVPEKLGVSYGQERGPLRAALTEAAVYCLVIPLFFSLMHVATFPLWRGLLELAVAVPLQEIRHPARLMVDATSFVWYHWILAVEFVGMAVLGFVALLIRGVWQRVTR